VIEKKRFFRAGMAIIPEKQCLSGMLGRKFNEDERATGAFSREVETGSRQENAQIKI
jgi:hypothetical protein